MSLTYQTAKVKIKTLIFPSVLPLATPSTTGISPDAVGGSQDPLVGDQGATASVVEIASTLVLQRHLRRTNRDASYVFKKNGGKTPDLEKF